MKRTQVLLSCSVLLPLYGCSSFEIGTYVPATPTDYETTVDGSRDVVFESLLSVVQSHNLSVDVLEKQSGFMQFKNATLIPSQMDQYCLYPFVKPGTTLPMRNFVAPDAIMPSSGGSVSISILLSPLSANSTKLKIHSSWIARFGVSATYPCTSLSVLEKEVEADLRSQLIGTVSPPAAPTPPGLRVGTKLFARDGAPFGTVREISGSTVRVSLVKGGATTVTREQALAMMQK